MSRVLAAVVLFWGGLVAVEADGGITRDTPISLALFIAGITGSVVLIWKASREWACLKAEIKRINERISRLHSEDK